MDADEFILVNAIPPSTYGWVNTASKLSKLATASAENFMYSSRAGMYWEIASAPGKAFTALEFVMGSGYGIGPYANYIAWQAFLDNVSVGSGTLSTVTTPVLGFSDLLSFDLLRFTSSYDSNVNFAPTPNAPAFDTVRAQYLVAQTPLPAAFVLFGTALSGLGLFNWLRRKPVV